MWSYNCFQINCLWKIFLILMQFLGELKRKKWLLLNYYEYLLVPELSSPLNCESSHQSGEDGHRGPENRRSLQKKSQEADTITLSVNVGGGGGGDWQVGVLRKIPCWIFSPPTVSLQWKHNVGSFVMKRKERELLFAYRKSKNTLDTESLLNGCFCSCVFRAVCMCVSKGANFIIDLAAGEVLLVNSLLVTDSSTPQGLC